ncbi:pyridoxal phosphate-dependent transferase [Mucor mucedo]|uniref:Aminotransferase class V domain-containing protein n=1 Tax=Mucor saturninus TaxID=64648 RepID=A0A8H7RF92_9FUNG|nr:pyridoxal phosphate-dependent transferase [Mucor mucedo]KAG2209157.1 hypothetical protein INT47_005449 [Mucor saturninus]KAI7893079.1 pyridoxal phosphate-dependent transferase [Mucor mucedo]
MAPELGRNIRSQFLFDPKYTSLNHGSYGSIPKALVPVMQDLRLKSEVNPDRWLRREMFPELQKNKETLAELVHVDPQELVFVFNAMTGINTVARSLPLAAGDKVIYFNTAYNSVESTIKFVKNSENVKLIKIDLAYPMSDGEVLDKIKDTIEKENSKNDGEIKLCFMDAISSVPAVRFPFESAIKLVREHNILSLVDGAHALGQIPLNLHETDPDFFITNCHKWLFAPRGCAILYVPFRNQRLIHPAIINSAYADHSDVSDKTSTFQDEFVWPGTSDFTNFMCVNAAMDYRKSLGGEDVIMKYTHDLAVEGGEAAAKVLGTEVMENPERSLTVSMVNVRIPLTNPTISDDAVVQVFIDKMLYDHDCMAPVYKHNGHWYTRLSAQVYNDVSDFELVAKALLAVCKELES